MSHLALFLLGPPRIERDGTPLEITRRKATALLTYLAVTNQPHARDSLAALLWPEYDQRRARADLRRILSVLNKALDGDWLKIEGDRVSLNQHAGFWLDVTYFERRLAECQTHNHPPTEVCPACLSPLAEAVNVYQDDFLAGFTLTDSAGFDEWQFFQSERLHKELVRAFENLVRGHTEQGELNTALEYAQRWAVLDSLHEGAHRHLMQLYTQTDQRAAALRQYQVCTQILNDELGVSPSSETKTLHEQIRAGESQYTVVQPAPLPSPALRHNLPVQPNSFIGRRSELGEIAQRLTDPTCHLLTLIGPGGVGKTRLAMESATLALSDNLFPDGVYFVPLTPLSRADSLVSVIGQALRLSFYSPESFADDPKDQLLDYLQTRQLLLVMDNFEHLLASPSLSSATENSGVDLLVELLQTAPGIKIMVTSQERLNLQAEWVLEIQGMRVPHKNKTEQLEEYSAVRLFLQHARRVQADFLLAEADKPDLIRICRLVGGMPLGLQLAAAWVRQLSCREIVREIEHNLDFLETSLRDVPERHRSLRAVFAHSWTLLSAEEQRMCRQLTVFQGKFRRAAAEQIAGASLPLLSSLTDKSFLHKTASGRYEMHQVLRQYAAEKLHEAPPEEIQTRDRACDFYVAFLQRKTEALRGPKQIQALAVMGEEIGNLRASWRWAVSRQKLIVIEQLVDGLYNFYELRGWVAEGVTVFGQAVEAFTASPYPKAAADAETWTMMLAMLKAREGALRSRLGQTEKARRLLQDSLTTLRQQEEAQEIAFAANHLGMVMRRQGDYQQAKILWQESLGIYRQFDQQWGVAWSLNMLGHLAGGLGEYQEARQLLQESLTIRQQIGNRRGMAGSLTSLGYVIFLLKDYEEAQTYLEEGLAIRREIGYRRGIAISLNYLGRVAGALNKPEESKSYFLEALKIVMDIRAIPLALDILVGLATVLNQEGETEEAAALLRFALHHPATAQETRDKAQSLLPDLPPDQIEASPLVDQPHLEAVVAQLLAAQAA